MDLFKFSLVSHDFIQVCIPPINLGPSLRPSGLFVLTELTVDCMYASSFQKETRISNVRC